MNDTGVACSLARTDRVLVTGANGFVGRETCTALADLNLSVRLGGSLLVVLCFAASTHAQTVISNAQNTDITAKLQAAHDACPALGCTIQIPPGPYSLSGTVSISKPIRIVGSGRESTVITYNPGVGYAFRTIPQHKRFAVSFADFKLQTANSISGIALLLAFVEPATVTNLWIDGFVGGIQITGNGTTDQSVGAWITTTRIENVTGAGAYAISLDHVADVYIDSLQAYTTIDDTSADQIIIEQGAQGIYINHSITIGGKHNLIIRSYGQGGNYGIVPSAIHCESSYFDSSTGGTAVVFDSSLRTNPMRAMFSNCWAGAAGITQEGVAVTPGAAGVDVSGGSDIQWIGGVIRRNAWSGFQVSGTLPLDLIQVIGARIIANNAGNSPGGAGVLIANPNATHVSVIANTIGNMIDWFGHQKAGISFNNGTNSSNTVAANTIDKNEDGTINWGATGCTLAVCPQEGPTKFANLGIASDGTTVYCPDCTIATPSTCMNSSNVEACACAPGGTGAFAKKLDGRWLCN
jgi:hypothetical protein